jgi:hypothetical protein
VVSGVESFPREQLKHTEAVEKHVLPDLQAIKVNRFFLNILFFAKYFLTIIVTLILIVREVAKHIIDFEGFFRGSQDFFDAMGNFGVKKVER